jgi:hypothetical protein
MGTSPVVNNYHGLAKQFEQLSDDVEKYELAHMKHLDEGQIEALDRASRALEDVCTLFMGEDIEAEMASIGSALDTIKKTTEMLGKAIQEIAVVEKCFQVAMGAGAFAFSILSKDPTQIEDSATALLGMITGAAGSNAAAPASGGKKGAASSSQNT